MEGDNVEVFILGLIIAGDKECILLKLLSFEYVKLFILEGLFMIFGVGNVNLLLRERLSFTIDIFLVVILLMNSNCNNKIMKNEK